MSNDERIVLKLNARLEDRLKRNFGGEIPQDAWQYSLELARKLGEDQSEVHAVLYNNRV